MNTVHLVYPSGPAIYTPFAIGRELSERLSRNYEVQIHHHRATYTIHPEPGDVLLGHPHWDPSAVFNSSVREPGWRRRLCLHPFAPGDPKQVAHLDKVLPHCDLFLAITGSYWIKALPHTHCRHFVPKVVHLDLAVNREHFPRVKTTFNPPGQRQFVYIGNHPWYKNLGYLDSIAMRMPHIKFSWIGSTKKRYRHLSQLGRYDFSDPAARNLLRNFDFLITVGNADANPTTIIESMAWGLIPICTPQSGYEGVEGIVNIPLNNIERACKIIEIMQQEDAGRLYAWQASNWHLIDTHFTWDRFASQVLDAIESDASPEMNKPTWQDQIVLTWNRIHSPLSIWHPRKLLRRIRSRLGWKK